MTLAQLVELQTLQKQFIVPIILTNVKVLTNGSGVS
jgi:hypothetical protein